MVRNLNIAPRLRLPAPTVIAINITAQSPDKKGADAMTFHDRASYERFNRKDWIVSIAEGV
jgi:hypothetical protein